MKSWDAVTKQQREAMGTEKTEGETRGLLQWNLIRSWLYRLSGHTYMRDTGGGVIIIHIKLSNSWHVTCDWCGELVLGGYHARQTPLLEVGITRTTITVHVSSPFFLHHLRKAARRRLWDDASACLESLVRCKVIQQACALLPVTRYWLIPICRDLRSALGLLVARDFIARTSRRAAQTCAVFHGMRPCCSVITDRFKVSIIRGIFHLAKPRLI